MKGDRKTIKAVPTVRARGWAKGTVLRSATWEYDRTLLGVDAVEVELRIPKAHDTTHYYRKYVKLFPADVQAVPD